MRARPLDPLLTARLCAALLLVSGLACASQFVPRTELHSEPIAFVFWDQQAARERAEILEELQSGPRGPTRLGVARLESMGDVLDPDASTARRRRLERFPGRIALLDPRTLELIRFDSAPPNARPISWSPDHKRLLFSSQHRDGGRTQLFEYDRDSGEVHKLTHGPALHLEGDYGPDGRLVISWVDVEERPPIAGIDIRPPGGGVGETVVTGVYPIGVRWSPQGDRILYSVERSSGRRPQTGPNVTAIFTKAPQRDAEPRALTRGRDAVYSPDGEWIVFSAQTDNGWKLRRMRSDGSGRAAIGASGRDEFNPAISPDGKHVLYVAEDGGIDRLFLRRMDGSGDRMLWSDGGAAFPVW